MNSLLKKLISSVFIFIISNHAFSQDTNSDILFKGIIKQSHDYSCGAAALAMLISGTVENSHVNELDVINTIKAVSSMATSEEQGYFPDDLARASIKLGHSAIWKHVSKNNLLNLSKNNQPVILLIGLNSEYPHYVVLKGISNNVAFLADPTRGNIRIPYDKLVAESLNEKHPYWYAMAVTPSADKPKDSILYLPTNESDRYASHVTVEQSNAITLATLPKSHQFIADYSFTASLGNDKNNDSNINSKLFSHALNIRYGITDNIEIGGSVKHLDSTTDISFDDNRTRLNNQNKEYSLYANHRFKLDNLGRTNLILGLNTSYAQENDVFGGGVNIIGYQNTEFAQIIVGWSIGKEFSHNQLANDSLPDYSYSGFIGANKPLGDHYLGSVNFSVDDGKSKDYIEFERSYSASTGLTYLFNKEVQISPSFTYSFGASEAFSVGINIAYISGF